MKDYQRYLGIFLIATATLLIEVTLTRVFSVIFFSNYAFLAVSSALFGYGISAVWLALKGEIIKNSKNNFLALTALFFGISNIVLLIIICYIPFNFNEQSFSRNVFYFSLYYVGIILPFIFSGACISYLFMIYSSESNILYFWDLIGASIGSLLIFFLIKKVGGNGLFWVCSIIAFLAMIILSQKRLMKVIGVLMITISLLSLNFLKERFEISPHISKRIFNYYYLGKKIVYTKWSSLTRIDVAKENPNWIIWIDCGTNQSFMPIVQPKISKSIAKPKIKNTIRRIRNPYSLPYFLRKEAKALIIGFGGGVELYNALNLGAKEIIGVEMDSEIINIILEKFKEQTGFIFYNDKIKIINNEGRSYIKGSKEKYDIIQQVHNATPIAIASGALNISETFLMTKEAFNDYLDKLNDNGILSLYRDGVERIFSLAINVLADRGIAFPYKNIAVVSFNKEPGRNDLFLLKKTAFTQSEINKIKQFAKRNNINVLYLPDEPLAYKYFAPFLTRSSIKKIQKEAGIILEPPTDSEPFFNQWLPLWHYKIKEPKYFSKNTIELVESTSKIVNRIFLIILIEGLIMGIFFIFLPLIKFSSLKLLISNKSIICYFIGLGLGFIFLEIVYMQKFILYLGHPSYSITFVLFSLLLSAGTGSYLSNIWAKSIGIKKLLVNVFPLLIAIIILSNFLINLMMEKTIQFPSLIKFLITFVCLFIIGIFLGMPFPTGINLVGQKDKHLVAWAWGINAYGTVMGSVFSLIIAITFGFNIVILLAAIAYCLSYLSIYKML